MIKNLLFFLAALPVGTLGEYLMHRFVAHAPYRNRITQRHKRHHKFGQANSVWGDFRDFLPGALPFCWLGFLGGPASGVAFLLGSATYVFFVALIHTWSHERPGLVFWMSPNVHVLHHGLTPTANFGILTTFWDAVFGTYRRPESLLHTRKDLCDQSSRRLPPQEVRVSPPAK